MRVENWESKLSTVIHDTVHNKDKFIRGKNDCGTFVINCIECITGKKVFNKKYKEVDISRVQRGDVLYYIDTADLDGTLGVCIGSSTMFNWKDGMQLIPNNKCKIAWRIE